MDTNQVVRLSSSVTLAGVLGAMIVVEYVLDSDRKLWDLTLVAALIDCQIIISQLLLWRVRTLRNIYTMGYRHGRHDANRSLMEAGFWLSDEAERDAQRNIGEV